MMNAWSRIEIAGKRAELFEPEGPSRFALLWLHSQDGSSPVANAAFTSLLRKLRLPCIVPHAPHSWWVDRICPEFDPALSAEKHLLRNVAPWITEHFRLPSRAIGIAGIEMGGQGAIRLGLKHPAIFRSVASLGGAIDFHELHGRGTPLDAMYDSRERCRQDTATLHMHPSEWPPHLWFACDPEDYWFRGNDRLNEKLRAYGVPHTADLESTGPDYFDKMLEPMLQFVVSGLEKESRRLM
jgi:S-formylglutathione hydrolase